jgi:hypothetical protein
MAPHSEIALVLHSGKSALDETVTAVSEAVLADAEAQLSYPLPPSYRVFVALGGLAELRFRHRVMAPGAIVEAVKYVDRARYVPFADNGCGDLYCWDKSIAPEPRIVFMDHETSEYAPDSESFVEWLRKSKF